MCAKFKEENVKIMLERNRGNTYHLSKGFSHCRSKRVTFNDAQLMHPAWAFNLKDAQCCNKASKPQPSALIRKRSPSVQPSIFLRLLQVPTLPQNPTLCWGSPRNSDWSLWKKFSTSDQRSHWVYIPMYWYELIAAKSEPSQSFQEEAIA